MKQTVSFYDFERAFRDMDRLENFSYEGRRVLFDYLEALEEEIGEEIELDVIALCCDFAEEHFKDIADNYDINISACFGDDDDIHRAVWDYLQDNSGLALPVGDDRFIYQEF